MIIMFLLFDSVDVDGWRQLSALPARLLKRTPLDANATGTRPLRRQLVVNSLSTAQLPRRSSCSAIERRCAASRRSSCCATPSASASGVRCPVRRLVLCCQAVAKSNRSVMAHLVKYFPLSELALPTSAGGGERLVPSATFATVARAAGDNALASPVLPLLARSAALGASTSLRAAADALPAQRFDRVSSRSHRVTGLCATQRRVAGDAQGRQEGRRRRRADAHCALARRLGILSKVRRVRVGIAFFGFVFSFSFL